MAEKTVFESFYVCVEKADRIVLSDNANVTATLVGCVEKAGTGTAVVRAGALGEGGTSVRYAPPDGTVLHFPFDGSLEEALNGPQGQMTPLAIAHGARARCGLRGEGRRLL